MPSESKTDDRAPTRTARRAVWLFTVPLVAVYALVMTMCWKAVPLPGPPGWPEAALLLLAAAGTLAALARHLPAQKVLITALFIGCAGGAADWLDLKTGVPFGGFTPLQSAGPELFHVLPWALPVIWIAVILNSRGVGRLILRPWRKTRTYGFWLIGITAALTTLFEFTFEPFAARVKDYWFWEPTKVPLAWQGTPWVNYIGWAVVTLLILAFATPMLINKQPHRRRPPDYHPLGVWLGGVLLFGAGCAAAGFWPAAAADGACGLIVAILAIRGARW